MPTIHYQESTLEHASRIGVTPRFVRIRRRVLSAKLEKRALPSDAPIHLQYATLKALMTTLAVKPQNQSRHNGSGNAGISFIPAFAWLTRDRSQSLIYRSVRRGRLVTSKRPAAEELMIASDVVNS